MPRKIVLPSSDLAELEQVVESDPRPEVRRRAAALRAVHRGLAVKDVALVLAVTQASIYNWLKRWREAGAEGLANQPRSGRPALAKAEYLAELEAALEQEPQALGYTFAIWTQERLRDHLEAKTGLRLSVKHLGEIMARQGYVYRRPKHDLKNLQDPEAKAQAQALLEELKKGPSSAISGSSLWTKRA